MSKNPQIPQQNYLPPRIVLTDVSPLQEGFNQEEDPRFVQLDEHLNYKLSYYPYNEILSARKTGK